MRGPSRRKEEPGPVALASCATGGALNSFHSRLAFRVAREGRLTNPRAVLGLQLELRIVCRALILLRPAWMSARTEIHTDGNAISAEWFRFG